MKHRPGLLLLVFMVSSRLTSSAGEEPERWWPAQVLPKTIIRTPSQQEFPAPRLARQMMAQSVAGLAAKSVNDGVSDEMVWVSNGPGDLEEWYSRFRSAHPQVVQLGTLDTWAIVERFSKRGIVKGYILYREKQTSGGASLDLSVNVATSLSGILNGIIVDEALEGEAREHRLKLLLDVRGKSQEWCFEAYKDQFNRRLLCTQPPEKPHARDLAIAQKALTIYGEEVRRVMPWLEPLSPILGWNGGDEFATTDLSTRYGHIQTATDWCMNLPVLMAGSEKLSLPRTSLFDPRTIDWADQRSAVAFVETDGDNVQWLQGNFFHSGGNYWDNPDRGRMPFGWSFCLAQLAQLCPQAISYAAATRSTNDTLIEWGGGYYYPDHFGSARKNPSELLAEHARRTWSLMKATGARIIGFNVATHDSPEARAAYQTFASQTDALLGILVFQYYPYEGGAGKTHWVKDGKGMDVPVITARYSIWENINKRPRAGTPAKIAREIRESAASAAGADLPRYDWVISHAWSYFKKAPGADEDTENLPQATAAAAGAVRGYSPPLWCAERLPKNIRVVSPEELVWRIRMKHDPTQTARIIRQFGTD